MRPFEQKIREMLVIDESSPSGLMWTNLAAKGVRNKSAGALGNRGYWKVNLRFQGKLRSFLAHRIVWFLAHGEWPIKQIDHANGDKSDNRMLNLREASQGENQHNKSTPKNNSSGVKGVSFCKDDGKWDARVSCDGKRIRLGLFDNIADAAHAVRCAREKLHGEFANHGIDTASPLA